MEESYDTNSTEEFESEDSPIIKELRSRNRSLEKKYEALMAEKAESEVAAQTQRAEVTQGIMDTLDLPGLTEDVLNWVEGDVTLESVYAALQARNIPVPLVDDAQATTSEPAEVPSASNVGQRVANIAAGKDTRSEGERIASAETPAELSDLMEELGLVRNHS